MASARSNRGHRLGLSLAAGFCLQLGLPLLPSRAAGVEVTVTMHPSETESLHTILRMTRERNRPYFAPRPDEVQRFAAASSTLFKEMRSPRCVRAIPLFKEAGFEVTTTFLGGAPASVLREQPTQRKGGGVYFIRHGAVPRERLVQVPHSFFDMGTLEVGADLANAAQARALYVNTVHRYQGDKAPAADDEDRAEAVADLAHQEETFFQRLTYAALAAFPQLQVIQVHGFGDGAVPENPQAAVVVSPGTAAAGAPEAARVAARLAGLLGRERVFLYPRDTRKFGAQRNAQGHAVAKTHSATFLHLELSRSLRTKMLSDSELRRAFIAAVIGEGVGRP